MDLDELTPGGYFSEFSWHSLDEEDEADQLDMQVASSDGAQLVGVIPEEEKEPQQASTRDRA